MSHERPRSPRDEVTVTAPQGATSFPDELLLSRGSLLGRYVILELLGSGGMSVVYSAYDPKLDRRIAIKVMRTSFWNEAGRQRALREAQALARLSHPNIVAVHDVGTLGDQLFIAMELVDGETLDEWLARPAARTLTWREILAVMMQAGRGIAAAHQAGLVHRDIKPSNIMVDRGGRARVMDFGVVAESQDRTTDRVLVAPSYEAPGAGVALAEPGTFASGNVVGTPSYMAPEQRDGFADERSDQYAFCVTLFEALTGARPSAEGQSGSTELARTSGRLVSWAATAAWSQVVERASPGRSVHVPRWLHLVVARGLCSEAAKRYESMEALLAALGRDPSARRKGAVFGALAVACVVAAALLVPRGGGAPKVCGNPRDLVVGVWGQKQRRAIHDNLARGGRPYAEETWRRLEAALEHKVGEWTDMRLRACEATHVRVEQSQAVLDLRVQCLDRQLWELRAVTDVLASQVGGEVVDNAVQAVLSLPPTARCADVALASETAPLPAEATARAAILATYADIARGQALSRAGGAREALPGLLAAGARAKGLRFAPLSAEALRRIGEVQSMLGDGAAAEKSLGEAMAMAAEGRDDAVLVAVAPALVHTLGYLQARPAEALALGRAARAMIARAGDAPSARSALLSAEGVTLWSAGRYDEAKPRFEEVIVLESQPGGSELRLATAYNTLGLVLKELRRHRDAAAMLDKAQALWERILGPEHPDVGRALNNQGELALVRRDLDRAEAAYARALAIFESAFGPSHRFVEVVLNNLGELDILRGRFAAGLARCERATAISAQTVDASHPLVAYHAACRAKALLPLRRVAEALEAATLAERVAAGAAMDATDVAEIRFTLARALWDSGGSRGRALSLASEAADTLAKAAPRKDDVRMKVERWLEEHGATVPAVGPR